MYHLIQFSVVCRSELLDKNPYKKVKARFMEVVKKIVLDPPPAGIV
jgi:hypothetical protein